MFISGNSPSGNVYDAKTYNRDFKFADKKDPFHQYINRIIRTSNLLLAYGRMNERTKTELQGMIYEVIERVRIIEEEFPEFFNENKYEECLEILKQLCDHCDIPFAQDRPSYNETFVVNKKFNPEQHQQLVLFCGHSQEGCAGHQDNEYLVSIDEKVAPDMVADYYSKSFWTEFPDKAFDYVNLEGYTPRFQGHQLREISRILNENGKVRIGDSFADNNEWTTIHAYDPHLLQSYFKKNGFEKYEIVKEEYHTLGNKQDIVSYYLYKSASS